MPELPEVEYVARQLRDELIGRRIASVTVFWPRSISGMEAQAFEQVLVGKSIVAIGRRAKYLLIYLDDGQVIAVHRRMSGNLLLINAPDVSAEVSAAPATNNQSAGSGGSGGAAPAEAALYVRVKVVFEDGSTLLYSDPRKFGRLMLVPPDQLATVFASLGPEPLEDSFTADVLAGKLARVKRSIKATLLDQSVVAGLGNIYADEALFAARIHPLRPAGSLTTAEITALHAAIQSVLLTGIEHGGTTFGRYRDAYNEAGTNLEHVVVYQKTGQPCPRCSTPIERIVVAQRGTHFCLHCQQPL